MEKSIVLIDAENVLRSWISYCRVKGEREKIDYVKLVDCVSEGTNLLRAYFYDGVQENLPVGKKNFMDALRRKGIQLRTKVLRGGSCVCGKCGHKEHSVVQKGVHVSLATDILRHAWQGTCEVCIVVSGDEDYKDAIECIKDKGLKVWVVSFKKSLSRELELSADRVIFIEDIFDEIKQEKSLNK